MEKKSFILHIDSLCVLDKMTNEQAGQLFKAIYEYQKTGEVNNLDFAMDMAITPFINQFKRDGDKYNSFVSKQKENGMKGGRPKKAMPLIDNPNNPSLYLETQKSLSDSVSDSVSVSDNEKDNVIINKRSLIFKPPTIEEVIEYFTEKGYNQKSAEKAFHYYDSAGWKDRNGTQVKNWKQKMVGNWFKDENKIVTTKSVDDSKYYINKNGIRINRAAAL